MLITEFGDAFKKIGHLHAHSHRLVPKQKNTFFITFYHCFIVLSIEIIDGRTSL